MHRLAGLQGGHGILRAGSVDLSVQDNAPVKSILRESNT